LLVGERTSYATGTFSWVDLATRDLDAAKDFYSGLLGWEYEEMPAGEAGVYVMARLDGRDVGALYGTDEQPPHWNSYVTVRSADEAARLAGELGASVIVPPFDVMDAGRMAVVRDPSGPVVAVWEARRHAGAALVNAPGALTWNDLITPDVEEAARFYGEWLGWTTQEKANGYRVIRNGGRTNGGIQPLPPEVLGPDVPPHWLPYFGTDGLERALGRVRELGGRVLLGPVSGSAGEEVVIADPQGATCALWAGDYDD
jgi:predicted enzyme related to lactoylglutathione lyase